MEGSRLLLVKHGHGVWMMNPSLIIIVCLEVLYFSFSPFKIYHETLMVFCYCLFSAFFLIFAFGRMGDCKWLIGFDVDCSRDIKFTHTF